MSRTVYVCDNGLVKVAQGINFRMGAIVLDDNPVLARYPDAWRPHGLVQDDVASQIEMLGDHSTILSFREHIRPLGSEFPPSLPSSAALPPPRSSGRPKWAQGEFALHYAEAEAATEEPRTRERVAANFIRLDGTKGIDPDSLRRLLRDQRRVG